MKINEIKLRLIKIDGINTFFGKGIYNTEKFLCVEKSGGFLFKKHKSIYAVSNKHIKVNRKGKTYCFINLANHTSFDIDSKKDIKLINQIQYVTQKENWEAHQQKMKMSVWAQLTLIFCGMGIFFLITSIIRSLGVMF